MLRLHVLSERVHDMSHILHALSLNMIVLASTIVCKKRVWLLATKTELFTKRYSDEIA